MAVKVYGELTPASTLGILGDAKTIIDRKHGGKMQEDINTDVVDRISDKDFDVDSGKGLGRILLKKGKSLASQVTNTNTVYIIQDDLQIGGGSAKLNPADSMTIGSTSYFYTEVTVGAGETIAVASSLIIAVQNSGYQWVSEGTSYTAQSDTVVRVCALPYAVDKVDYTFTGQSTLTIPANCTLKFDGGSISGGTIVFNNTKLENPKFVNCVYNGNVQVDFLDDKNFTSTNDDNCLSWLITQALLLGIKLTINRDYTIDITKGISGSTRCFVEIPNETLVKGAEIDFGGHTIKNTWGADGIRAFINAGNNIHGLSITNLNYDDITESGNDTHRFVKSAGTTILLSNGNCDNINIENITLLGGDSVYRHGNYQPDQNLVTTGVVDSSFSHIKVKNSGYSIAIYRGVNLDINVEALHTHRGIYLCGVENARVKYRGLNPSETHCHVMCGEESHYLTDEALAVAKEKAAAGISDLSQYTGWDMIGCSNIDIVAEILPDEIETAEITSEDAFQSGGSTYYGKSILMVQNEKLTITNDPVPSGVTIWYQDSSDIWHNTGEMVWQRTPQINPKDVKIVGAIGTSVEYNIGVPQAFVVLGSYGNGDGVDKVFAGRITKKTIHRNIRITPINRNKLSDIQGWFSSYHIGRDDIEMQLDNIEVHGGDLSKVKIPWLLSDEHCKASIRIVGGYYSDANKKTYVNMASSNVNDSDVRVIFENSTFGNIGASSPCTAIFVNSQYDYAGLNAHLKVHTYPNYSVNDGGTNGNAGYGVTANRPTYNSKNTGSMYFDTILKRPVFWNGSAWIDPITFNHASKAYLDMGDVGERKGTIYYDLLLNKPLRYTGVRWVDANGKGYVKDFGTTAERPLARYGGWESYQASKPTNGKTIYVGFAWHNQTNNTYEIATAIDQSTGAITWESEATLHPNVPNDAPRTAASVEARDAAISAEYAYNNLYNGYNCWIGNWGWPCYIVSRTRTGAGTEASPYVYSVQWAPRKYYTDLLISADAGYVYFDRTLQKSIYAKTIDFAGNIFWAEADGAKAGVQRTGTTAQRPVGNDIYVGFEYFDTDLGKTIYASAIASSSPYTVTWVEYDGEAAGTTEGRRYVGDFSADEFVTNAVQSAKLENLFNAFKAGKECYVPQKNEQNQDLGYVKLVFDYATTTTIKYTFNYDGRLVGGVLTNNNGTYTNNITILLTYTIGSSGAGINVLNASSTTPADGKILKVKNVGDNNLRVEWDNA